MFFKKKSDKEKARCFNCESKVSDEFMFCPYCGESLVNPEEEMKEFGLLGRNDLINEEFFAPPAQLGMMEKMVNSLFKTLVKNIEQQARESGNEKSEVTAYPNGIKIKIGMPLQGATQATQAQPPAVKAITEEQIKKMSGLPRAKAKMTMRRLNNKLIYELNTPGITSTEDVLLAKIESGYEVKAIS